MRGAAPSPPRADAGSKSAGAGEASAAAAVSRALAAGRTWIVDPLDGTINYANGIPYFCVSVGLVVDGRPAVGAVCDPMRGETYWAAADGPAMLGDRVVHASAKDKLTDCVISLSLGGRAVATRGRAVRRAVRASRNTGSAALALAYVANGRFDAFLQSGGMSAWDVAAAGLIAERGGAVVTDGNGGTWFDVDKATRAFGIVAAPSAHHAELLRLSREAPRPRSWPAAAARPLSRAAAGFAPPVSPPGPRPPSGAGGSPGARAPTHRRRRSSAAGPRPRQRSSSTSAWGIGTPSSVVRRRARSR